jgi:Dyp-type peroxidase family
MPVALDRPLPKQPNAAERAMLRLLQGNILKGHGRCATAHVFLRFDPARQAAARTFLRTLVPMLTSASEQHEQQWSSGTRPAFRSCVLSYAGYLALGVPSDATPGNVAFRAGMKARGALLGDTPSPRWDPHFQADVHAMVLLAGDPDAGDAAASAQVDAGLNALTAMLPYAVRVLGVERGRIYRNEAGRSIEHFGFVDGRSGPLLREVDVERELANGGKDHWDPAFPMHQVLSYDPGASAAHAFGSYLVFRKLEQDVRGFLDAERELAATLQRLNPNFDRALAGAMLVGRFRDGTPVLLQPQDGAKPIPNDFDYASDPHGEKCPFHAHIRKVNPRGDTVRIDGKTLDDERYHQIARRGILYGTRSQDAAMRFTDRPRAGVGLLFMAFQRDLVRHFEFLQRNWANDDAFARPATGIDTLMGQGAGTDPMHRAGWGDPAAKTHQQRFADFVTLKGGEYFYAPSIAALREL